MVISEKKRVRERNKLMLPWLLFGCAVIAVIILFIKIILLYKGIEEISTEFEERINEDTNNVIYVSGNDRWLKALAENINKELRALRSKRYKYQNGDRELKEAVTNISHDLRTPLTAIYGYLELLKKEQIESTVRHYLDQIQNRADALKYLTEELFQYSIILSVEEEKREAVILNRVLENSLLSCYDIFHKHGIEPEIIIPDKEVMRYLDEGALKRIFNNILDNAIKYSKGDLRVELSEDGTITFCNSAENLDKVSVERLFDRFFTVETGRSATGLGLAIARLLSERMKGRITANYSSGMLTIFLKF